MKKFAERLKDLRLERGITQTQLAEATGISHTSIVYYENEKQVPNAIAVVALANYFNVTTDYLLGVED